MRISDWSSDVCSSDLRFADPVRGRSDRVAAHGHLGRLGRLFLLLGIEAAGDSVGQRIADLGNRNIAVDAGLAGRIADRVAQHAAQYTAPDAAARLALGAAAIVVVTPGPRARKRGVVGKRLAFR